jgi:hypothetical protein
MNVDTKIPKGSPIHSPVFIQTSQNGFVRRVVFTNVSGGQDHPLRDHWVLAIEG